MTLLDGTEVKVGDRVRVKSTGRWKAVTVIELLNGGGVDKAIVELQGVKLIRSRYQIRQAIRRVDSQAKNR